MKKVLTLGSVALFAPFVAFAQPAPDEGVIIDFLDSIQALIDVALPLIIGIAVLLFLWGLVQYILKADDAEARASARSLMIWGVVIIFVMVSLWGLVNLLDSVFGLEDTVQDAPATPGIAP